MVVGQRGLLGPKKAQLRGDQHGLLSLAAAEKLAWWNAKTIGTDSRIIERTNGTESGGCIPNYNLITKTFPTWQKAAAMAEDRGPRPSRAWTTKRTAARYIYRPQNRNKLTETHTDTRATMMMALRVDSWFDR